MLASFVATPTSKRCSFSLLLVVVSVVVATGNSREWEHSIATTRILNHNDSYLFIAPYTDCDHCPTVRDSEFTSPKTTSNATQPQQKRGFVGSYDANQAVKVSADGKIHIRIGHIGAVGALPNDYKVLNISRDELYDEGVLGEDIEFEIISRTGCGESFEGVAVAAELFHQYQVRAFIGPYCMEEMEAVAKMGAFWNIPVISYMATSNAMNDKNIYKTLARASSKSPTALAQATSALLLHYKWLKVAVVTNTGTVAFDRVVAFEEVFKRTNIKIVKKVMFEENSSAQDIINSGLLSDIESNARIIVCVFSATRDNTKEFMQATYTYGMHTSEYAYVLPWIQSGPKDILPWLGADGTLLQKVKEYYTNSIIVDDVAGFDDAVVTNFYAKVEERGLSREQLDAANIFGYLHLYDSMKLYATALRKVLNETNDPTKVTDGRAVWNSMRRLQFEGGATGTVLMDDLADRAPFIGAFYVSVSHEQLMKMVTMESTLIPKCDGLKDKIGCFQLKLTDVMTGFWPSESGAMPLDEPLCGYRNQRCSWALEIIIAALFFGLVVLSVAGFFVHRHWEIRQLDKMPWRIFREDLKLIDEEQVKSMLSVGSSNTKISNVNADQKRHAIIGVNTHATYHRYSQRRTIKFCRDDLQLLTQMKQVIHDNLNVFLGMSFNQCEEMLVLWKFCSRGTVQVSAQDIIYNANVNLDAKFHAAFVKDITLGLEYLHASPIGYHGSLTPWACLIDRNWMVKLTDFGIANPIEKWEKQGLITVDALTSDNDKSGASQRTSALYCAPEMLKNRETNRRRMMDQSWVKQSQARRQSGDIYAFGMVMYEIIFRALPFPEGTDINELVDTIADGSRIVQPQIQNQMSIPPDLAALLRDCWSENPDLRPSIRRVRLNTDVALKTKGSLVDQMMRMMEQYANNLEKLVAERTGMLEEANLRADKLLSQLLPKSESFYQRSFCLLMLLFKCLLGRPVPPKLFTSATVLFSDIVGFTSLCSTSTPLEVVNMLNGIYTGFDECIARHGAYKVETIGDAYMVVSGIPEENGTLHIMRVADVALEMREYLADYQIPHRRDHRIKCRWGFHTGSVAAGVVGLTAPRYCLFGDTASRMESTGLPGMIQISTEARDLLNEHYPEFSCTKRGEVEVKGKGVLITYWLDGKKKQQQQVINIPL
uniref:guanylate cyclase n=1 Tax=Ascaris lumbricoides TaxID=6252 RepID=A0A0M3HPB8_ASCLU